MHWYIGEGMEDDEFEEAKEGMIRVCSGMQSASGVRGDWDYGTPRADMETNLVSHERV